MCIICCTLKGFLLPSITVGLVLDTLPVLVAHGPGEPDGDAEIHEPQDLRIRAVAEGFEHVLRAGISEAFCDSAAPCGREPFRATSDRQAPAAALPGAWSWAAVSRNSGARTGS